MALFEDYIDIEALEDVKEISQVYVCGICEEICNSYLDHNCLKKYKNHHIDENHYCYPLLEDGVTIIRRALLENGREELITEKIYSISKENNKTSGNFQIPNSKNKKVKTKAKFSVSPNKRLNDTEVELLINEVQKRVPLWNHHVPLKERNQEAVSNLWKEVSMALKGKLDAEECKKKFKYIRDTHRKIIQNENKPIGSSRVDSTDEWEYYRCCEFLRDTCLIRPTRTNVDEHATAGFNNDGSFNNDSSNAMDDSFDESTDQDNKSANTKGKKRQEIADSVNAINRIADIISKDKTSVALPALPKLDQVGRFLIGIGYQLRQLPDDVQLQTIIEILQLIREKNNLYVQN
ncbi:uncharacterized protein LOC141535649 isoform X1 [Cotesia typhae]|uniref:uncharacterized protein LOC141535649 isoform X1 n=1 Tax=Cotesia typhae TaxID=2053667 RepID=UPI003D68026C